MPVYNIAANQQLARPVDAMYEGKAVRLALKNKDLANQALQQEIDANLPERKAQVAEGNLELRAKEYRRGLDQDSREAIERGSAAGVKILEEGGSVEDANKAFRYAASPEEYDEAIDDGVVIPEEVMRIWAPTEDTRRTLSLEESMALPGMTEDRAKNSVIQEDDSGQIFIDDAPTGMTEQDLATRETAVNPAGVSKNTIDFQDNVIGAVGAVQMGTELLTTAADNPEALGMAGGFMRFGSNLVSGAKAIADWAGYEQLPAEQTEKQNIGAAAFDYDNIEAGKLGISGAEAEKFRAGVYGIAFAAAVAEQGTRPTDKDIQQFIDQIGGRATSAQSFRETIVQFMRRQDRRLKTIADVKRIPDSDREAAFSSWTPAFNQFMETYADTAKLETATVPETGQRFIKIDGEWEEF